LKNRRTAETGLEHDPPKPAPADPSLAVMDGIMDGISAAFSRFSQSFNAGEPIFAEFELGDTFYFIQSGQVELVKIIGGIEKKLAILQPSEMFGEMAILENSPRSASAVAITPVEVLVFSQENFEILISGNPQMALKLLKILAYRIYEAKRRFMILTLDDPQFKVADVFLMLNESLTGQSDANDRREFKTTVEDIAHWAAMDISKTREVLQHFITQGRIGIRNDTVTVNNIKEFGRLVSARRKH
jgi:CRP-like cAMP-binding protein